MTKPNILYIHSHDTGRQIEPLGAPVRSPVLQSLAERGVLFRQAFCVASSCSASRASFHTGQYPHQNGMTGLAHRGWKLNDYDKTLVKYLKKHGYKAALVGEHHIAPNDQTDLIGYDEVNLLGNYQADAISAGASEWLRHNTEKYWFLSCGFWNTHRTSYPKVKPGAGKYSATFPIYPDRPNFRDDYAALKASVAQLDEGIGNVLRTLQETGQMENTIIIAATDHAPGFPEYKANVTDKGLGVYLIMAGPGIAEGHISENMVSLLDVFPTICDMTGAEMPEWLEGKSLKPMLEGQDPELHDALFAEANYHAAYEPQRSVRTNKYRLVKRYDHRKELVMPNIDDGPNKQPWAPVIKRPELTLFDIEADPLERVNLADDPSYSDVLKEMEGILANWQKEKDDPLLDGALQAPEGVLISDVDDFSADDVGGKY